MYKEEYIKVADAPEDFKVYESRDGMFSDRIGPYFIKGRYPDVIMGIRILDHHSNLNGVSHGGLLMAFVNTIGGYIAAKAGEGPSVTANFNANFMRPAPVGAWVEGTGKALKVGRKAVFIRVELTLENKLIFSAEGIWQKINKEKGIIT